VADASDTQTRTTLQQALANRRTELAIFLERAKLSASATPLSRRAR
jgi:hypothetical protein